MVGAQILREYQRRFGDSEAALQMYAGALRRADLAATPHKVFAEKRAPGARCRARSKARRRPSGAAPS